MKTALILGGAKCLYDDVEAALKLFTPDIVIAVKDIGITYPIIHHWVTFHIDRTPRELATRRATGLRDPECIWHHAKARNVPYLDVPTRKIVVKGGSSGMMGVLCALELGVDKAVLTGIPLDPAMPHYHRRKHGKPWRDATLYRAFWKQEAPTFNDRVRSMSGYTKELLGEPTAKWFKMARAEKGA